MACITTTITGNIEEWGTGNSYFTVFLRSNGRVLDSFDMTTENQEILTELREGTLTLLGIHNSTQCFLELISELGLELPKPWHKYWKPKELEIYWSISDYDNITDKTYYYLPQEEKMVVTRYNMFPTKELAERAVNLSELGRLSLLWQYANGCVYEADWKDGDTKKYFIRYDYIKEEVCHDYNVTISSDTLYFETIEQVKTFIEMYETEIKKIMGGI